MGLKKNLEPPTESLNHQQKLKYENTLGMPTLQQHQSGID